MKTTRSLSSISHIVRAQLVSMHVPVRRVNTEPNNDGKFQTHVFTSDEASVAEALRTLHPEHKVFEEPGFVALVSDGQV